MKENLQGENWVLKSKAAATHNVVFLINNTSISNKIHCNRTNLTQQQKNPDITWHILWSQNWCCWRCSAKRRHREQYERPACILWGWWCHSGIQVFIVWVPQPGLCYDGTAAFVYSLGLTLHILFYSTHCSLNHWLISCLNSSQTHRAVGAFINPLELINTMAHIPGI